MSTLVANVKLENNPVLRINLSTYNQNETTKKAASWFFKCKMGIIIRSLGLMCRSPRSFSTSAQKFYSALT
jgi:hypothetical protein